jgi:hypothetical protein
LLQIPNGQVVVAVFARFSIGMKLSRTNSQFTKEKKPVKRILLILGAAVLFLNALVIPTIARADGGGTGTNCGTTLCKP